MTDRNNPKTYYNDSAYTGGSKVSKPDDVSYPPPPPYENSQAGASSSSAYSPSAPPSTYATAQDYPNYGSLDPNRPGVLDSRASPPTQSPYSQYSQPPQQPLAHPPIQQQQYQQYPQRGIPDAGSPTPSSQSNPHLPRDWVPDGGNNNNNNKSRTPSGYQHPQGFPGQSPSSRISMPGFTRQEMDNGDPGCCKKWCKYIFVAILIWLVILKYNANFQWGNGGDGNGHVGFWQCKGRSLQRWNDIPNKIDVEQDLFLAIEGPVTMSDSFINIHPSNDRDMGWIEPQINISPSSLVDNSELYYRLEKQDDETRLILHLPSWNWSYDDASDRPCVQVKINVYLPDKIKSLRASVNNVPIHVTDGTYAIKEKEELDINDVVTLETDRLELLTTNAPIIIDTAAWEGDTMALTTTNAEIKLSGTAQSGDWIRLQSTNGALITTNTLESKGKISLSTTNSKILCQSLIAKDLLEIKTANAAINLQSKVTADQIIIKSTNGPLQLPLLVAQSSLSATTTNALIDAQVSGEKDPQVLFSTSNSRIKIRMVIIKSYRLDTHHVSSSFSFSSSLFLHSQRNMKVRFWLKRLDLTR
ncbi:hypothetical protein BC941DRAFT_427983 [Chlamydoabsidia padenii]|nr:hypothetical protein BC941DRAFT_427983 [Chlamydoabsidia padenii]